MSLQRLQTALLMVNFQWVVNNGYREVEATPTVGRPPWTRCATVAAASVFGELQLDDDEAVPVQVRKNVYQ